MIGFSESPNLRELVEQNTLLTALLDKNFIDGLEVEYAVPEVEHVFYNGRHTTVVWEDGEKTTVGCMKNEPFDEYAGFAAAVLKRLYGSSTEAKRYLDERKVVQQIKERKEKKNAKVSKHP